MDRRLFLKASAASAAALSMPAIGRAADSNVLRFVPYADVAIIDPIWTSGYSTRTHALLVYDTLYGLDENQQPHPQMVEGHVVEADGLKWTMTLRSGLVFHDGTQVLARDAVASLKRWGARDAFGQSLMAATDELSAPDDRTIIFRLKRPFPLLVHALARPSALVAAIMPERLALTDPFKQIPEATGSGPFRYVPEERVAGARHVYARHAAYVPREGIASFTAGPRIANVERVEFQVMPDPATAVAALSTGAIDWIEQPLIDLLPVLKRNQDIVIETTDANGMVATLRLNHLQPPFNNPAVRRVILKSISQTDCMTAVAGEDRSIWRDNLGFFSATSPMANDAGLAALSGKQDYAVLTRELKEAGYNGERVVLLAGQDVPRISAVCQVVAEAMQKIGINLDFISADWGTVLQRVSNRRPITDGGWSCYVTYWSGLDLATPATSAPLRSNGAKAAPGWPDSPALEALRDRFLETGDIAAQKAIAREVQLQAMQDVPFVPAGQYFQPIAYRKNIVGIQKGLPVFTNLRKV